MSILRVSLVIVSMLAVQVVGFAQCAMCRTQVVNNVSHGETSLAAGLNFGILYLFVTPYLLIALIVFLWFKYSRRNAKNKSLASRIGGQMSKM